MASVSNWRCKVFHSVCLSQSIGLLLWHLNFCLRFLGIDEREGSKWRVNWITFLGTMTRPPEYAKYEEYAEYEKGV